MYLTKQGVTVILSSPLDFFFLIKLQYILLIAVHLQLYSKLTTVV